MDKENWNNVEIEQPKEEEKIEVELEKDKEEEVKEEEVKEEVKEPENVEPPSDVELKKEEPKELEGIKTDGAQKRIKQLIRQRKERDEQIQQLIHKTEQLQKNLEEKEKSFSEVSKLNLEATEKQLKDKIELARTAYKDAYEQQDKDKILKAQEMLNEAQVDLKTLGSTKKDISGAPPVQPTQPVQRPIPQPDPKAQEWAAKNTWFGPDRVMTAAALAVDAELKAEGYSTTDDEFYEEIDRRMQENFPHKFKTNGKVPNERAAGNTSQPAQVVGKSSRTSPNSKKKVKLSQNDVKLAQKWGIPLEKYAQEKLKAAQADGEYTNVI